MLIRTHPNTEVVENGLLPAHHADIAKIQQRRCGLFVHRQVKGIKN